MKQKTSMYIQSQTALFGSALTLLVASLLASCDAGDEFQDDRQYALGTPDIDSDEYIQDADDTLRPPDSPDSIYLSKSLKREVEEYSVDPQMEFFVEGNYIALYADAETGRPGVFEWVPDGGRTQISEFVSLLEIATALAPPGVAIPDSVRDALTFRQMDELNGGRLVRMELDGIEGTNQTAQADLEPAFVAEVNPLASNLTCSKSEANYAYDSLRPGAFTASEWVTGYPTSGLFVSKKANREKDWQTLFQTNLGQKTPWKQGGVCYAPRYVRGSATECTGAMTIRGQYCAWSINTCRFGCGNAGSDVIQTLGPFSFSNGSGTYKLWPTSGDETGRVQLYNMSSGTDMAVWSGMATYSPAGVVDQACFN